MAFDTARSVVVLFGGYTWAHGYFEYLGDTWEFDGTSWTQRSSTGPARRYAHAMAYDPVRQVVVLGGGEGGGSDFWEWDGTAWSRASLDLPMATSNPPAFAYDAHRQRLVYYNGSETWELGGPDADCDQVADAVDACPGTPAGASVDTSGCSAIPFDFNRNGAVDVYDLLVFDTCGSGPSVNHDDSANCQLADADDDGDVDMEDFAAFQRCYSTFEPASPLCAN